MYSLLETNLDIEQFLESIHRYIQIGVHLKGYNSARYKRYQREITEVVEFYVDEDNNKQIITPKVILNNCYVENDYIAIEFTGGSTEEEFKDVDTNILNILGGTYKCSEKGIAALHVSNNLSPFTYFNTKDVVIEKGVFECEGVRTSNAFGWSKKTVNIRQLLIYCMDIKVKYMEIQGRIHIHLLCQKL